MRARIIATVSLSPTADEGQGLVEYGLIILLVSIAAIGSLTLLRDQIVALLGLIIAAMP
jgi:Flp pilus assembly pilin Flp